MNHTDDLMVPINNRLDDEDTIEATGLDAAVGAMAIASGKVGGGDEHPERRRKVSCRLCNQIY